MEKVGYSAEGAWAGGWGGSLHPELQVPLFLTFLAIYSVTVVGNLGMIALGTLCPGVSLRGAAQLGLWMGSVEQGVRGSRGGVGTLQPRALAVHLAQQV